MLYECLSFITNARKYDTQHKTTTFLETLRVLSKLCNVFTCLSAKNAKLCTSLFNKCAETLLTVVLIKDVKTSHQDLILQCLSSVCKKAEQQNIYETFKKVSLHLKYVAKMVQDMSVDTQLSIYTILLTSVSSKEEAAEKAKLWFNRCPTLIDAFVECFSKSYSEGCGIFLDKLFELRVNSNGRDIKKISAKPPPPSHEHGSITNNSNQKFKSNCLKTSFPDGGSLSKGVGVSSQGTNSNAGCDTKIQFLKPVADWKNKESCNSKQNPLKARLPQTPYHPDQRKPLSLHQQQNSVGFGSSQSSASKPPSTLDEFHLKQTQRIGKTGQNERAGSREKMHSSITSPMISQQSMRVDSVKFDISPKNKKFCPGRTSDLTASTFHPPSAPKKSTSRAQSLAQSPLSDLLEEDHCSKVTRWLSGFSSEAAVTHDDIPDSHVRKSTKLNHDAFDNLIEKGQKRSAPEPPAQSKKIRVEVPPTPHQINKQMPVEEGSVIGTVKYELPSVKLKKTICDKPENEASLRTSTSIAPGKKGGGKRVLYSKSRDREYMGDSPFLDVSQTLEPIQDRNSHPGNRPSKHWEQKLRELNSNSQISNNQVYNFGRTESSEKSFKMPSKTPARKRTSKTPKVLPRFACLVGKHPKNSEKNENEPPKKKSNQGVRKVVEQLGVKPVDHKASLKEATEAITSHVSNSNKQSNFTNGSNITLISSKKINNDHVSDVKSAEATNLKTSSRVLFTNLASNDNCLKSSTNNSTSSICSNANTKRNWKTVANTTASTPQDTPKDEETMTRHYYSPIEDDSFNYSPTKSEKSTVLPKTQSATTTKSETIRLCSPTVPQPCSVLPSTDTGPRQQVGGAGTEHSQIFTKKPIDTIEPEKRIMTKGEPNADGSYVCTVKSAPTSSRKNKSREWDSGLDTSDIHSTSSKEAKSASARKESINSQFLRLRLRDYLKRANDANSEMSSHQNVMSTELVEIKSLVDKLSLSVGRCHTASNSNQAVLRQQTSALEGCSKYLGPYEDQTFPAKVPTAKYMDYQEFARRIRAKNAERMRKLLQTVIDENLPLSPPSSDSE